MYKIYTPLSLFDTWGDTKVGHKNFMDGNQSVNIFESCVLIYSLLKKELFKY